MVYVLYKSPTNQIIIGDSNLSLPNSILPISLYGHDYVGDYGQTFQSNLYSILENFNSGQIVPKPVAGMLWFDNFNYTPGILKIYTTENKWKKIDYTTDIPGYVTITGAKVEGKQLLATLVEANNPFNISWSWQKDGVAFTPAAGTVVNQKTCTITTTTTGLYKATVVYSDDFNTGITLSYSVTVTDAASAGVSDNAGVLVIQPDYDVYVGTKLVATLTDNNGPTNLRWTWIDSNNTSLASTDVGMTSSITPDAAGLYTASVQYFDTINITVPSSLSAQVSVSAKGTDYIGYVKITGSLLLNQPLTATLNETDIITGDIAWVWTVGSDRLTGHTADVTGKISTYTPTVNGTYTAQAIYRDASHMTTPAKPQDSVIVDVYDINTPASTTSTTTKAPASGDSCSDCATHCSCCCCSGVSLPCDDGTGTITTNASGGTGTITTNASGGTGTITTNASGGTGSTTTGSTSSTTTGSTTTGSTTTGSTTTGTTTTGSTTTGTTTTNATTTTTRATTTTTRATTTTTRATTTTTRAPTTRGTTIAPTAGIRVGEMTNPVDYEMSYTVNWGTTQDFDCMLLTYDDKGVCTSVSNMDGLADNLTDVTWTGDYISGPSHESYRMKLRLMCTDGVPDNVKHVVLCVCENDFKQFNSMTTLSTQVGLFPNAPPYTTTYNMLPTVTGAWHIRVLARFTKYTKSPSDTFPTWVYYVYGSKVLPLYSRSMAVGEFLSKLSIDARTT